MHERPETHAPEEGVARDARDAAYALGSPREPPLHADARRVGRGEPHHDEEDADKYHRKSHGAQAWEPAPQLDDRCVRIGADHPQRSEEHTSELQSLAYLVCRLLLEKKNKKHI